MLFWNNEHIKTPTIIFTPPPPHHISHIIYISRNPSIPPIPLINKATFQDNHKYPHRSPGPRFLKPRSICNDFQLRV